LLRSTAFEAGYPRRSLSAGRFLSKTSGPRRFGHRKTSFYFNDIWRRFRGSICTLFAYRALNSAENERHPSTIGLLRHAILATAALTVVVVPAAQPAISAPALHSFTVLTARPTLHPSHSNWIHFPGQGHFKDLCSVIHT
jgi:hypothetical protein